MACIYIETSRLNDILTALPELPPHNWLITALECYDDCGWEGCEKWGKSELFLTDEELLRDINLRNPWIIWGVFSAIPIEYSREDIYQYNLPESEIPYYLSNHILPQHPLAFLELYVDDGEFTYVSAHDSSLLTPLYQLPYKTRNEEADNQTMNAQLCHIQDILRGEIPDVSPEIANELQWNVWLKLFKNTTNCVDETKLHPAIMKEYQTLVLSNQKFLHTYWDPYQQK